MTHSPERRIPAGGLGRTRGVLLLPFLVSALALWRWCPFRLGIVKGTSMEPVLRNGQVFVFQRDYYRTQPLRRGDVVLVRVKRLVCVKRVYAIGGDLICEMKSRDAATLLIGPDRHAHLARALVRWQRTTDRAVVERVPEDALWVLGDNFPESCDSRHFGAVPQSCILGRVLGVRHGRPAPPGVVLRQVVNGQTVTRL